MKKIIYLIILYIIPLIIFAGEDSLYIQELPDISELQEVVIISHRSVSDKVDKPLSNVEQYLERMGSINMIKRGAYASEPYINGMPPERSVITIDGMRIYSACTDRMDPVTSYVEISNLDKADVHGGQMGSSNGSSIAGSLDLVQKKAGFGYNEFKGMLFTGIESNNIEKIIGTRLSYSHPKFYTDFNLSYRDAENYKAGKGEKIAYSQFSKVNTAINLGYKVGEHQEIETSFIYDHAFNVGYPALTMDVDFARAFITSIEYKQHHISDKIYEVKTKLYFNSINHRMDDSQRPDVPIRMDMPGKNKTIGYYTMLMGETPRHIWKFNFSGHHNQSLAEMTMFSNQANEKDMYMLTWPNIHTNYFDVYGEDAIYINKTWKTIYSIGAAIQHNQIHDPSGLESLKIFYPEVKKNKTRFLSRAAINFLYNKTDWEFVIGTAYGERAPSITEAYGYYLFNSFDQYDYIGNPLMKNEKSFSINSSVAYSISKLSFKLSTNYFLIFDYIIGKPNPSLTAMTIGASGIKQYEQLNRVHQFNGVLSIDYKFAKNWQWNNKLTYRRGVGANGINLPLIQPFSFSSELQFKYKTFSTALSVNGSAKHSNYSAQFGENKLPAYAILNFSASKKFFIKRHSIVLKTGLENMLNTKYTTFADWNQIPRMGINFFFNAIWSF